ncbi:histidinol-phosphate transaminase [uncultured Croceitalea sp.]|uniref:histidinol-phosphate transaminase n=1 Tax=uncultured Croceitalea sp. TaxID=1798908 RepID=UPI003305B6F2
MKFDLDNLIRENVKALKPYASARDEYVATGAKMVFLDANENPFENGVNRYPDPHQRTLKAVLASQKEVTEPQLLLGNGSDEVLDLLFRAFCEPNRDNVISLPPTYGMYKVLAGTNAIENKEVLLNDGFQPNVDAILNTVDKDTKLLFLCSPNNPSGNLMDASKIEKLLINFPGLVVIDEAYIDFTDEVSWVRRLHDFPNLVVTQTLSKAYGMAAIRLGICYASESIIAVLKKIKPPYNVNELTQKRALAGVNDQTKVRQQVAKIIQAREKLETLLSEIPYVHEVFESKANFILVRVDDADKRYGQLLQKGIVVRNRSLQPRCENTLRFTLGTEEENEELLKALKTIA